MKCKHEYRTGIAIQDLLTNGTYIGTLAELSKVVKTGEGIYPAHCLLAPYRATSILITVHKCIHCGHST